MFDEGIITRPSQIIWHTINHERTSNKHFPLISFVIPTLNSGRTLKECLHSIVKQEYPSIEIIIVDGGSVDNTVNIGKKYNAKILRSNGVLGAARQLGINCASGELIANWDSDVYIPHVSWLRKAVQTLLYYPNASTLWVYNTCPPAATSVERAFSWYSWRNNLELAKKGHGFWGGGNSIFRKSAIEKVGGFNVNIDTGEDFDLAKKLSSEGYKIVFFRNNVYHDTFRSLSELVRKDIRRSKNFKKEGLKYSMGIPFSELIWTNLKIGLLVSFRNLYTKKKTYFAVVPVIFLLRGLTYAITYVLS